MSLSSQLSTNMNEPGGRPQLQFKGKWIMGGSFKFSIKQIIGRLCLAIDGQARAADKLGKTTEGIAHPTLPHLVGACLFPCGGDGRDSKEA